MVGDFNGREPGTHPLTVRKDRMRAVTAAMPTDQRIAFRRLAHGDHWFDDQEADGHDGVNGLPAQLTGSLHTLPTSEESS
ncbi:hypothetical protein GCM10009760_49630 [Kitasatospora kazusensis]|uniref:Uncharacterized protein n=1 Tax=Kitasatospora kazusensis TaxID=407974 RepID=A0ABN3A2K5_9ACTN